MPAGLTGRVRTRAQHPAARDAHNLSPRLDLSNARHGVPWPGTRPAAGQTCLTWAWSALTYASTYILASSILMAWQSGR